ncbi:DUF2971 domain-containing protein [Jiangella sp. DSM 45060]|uniref:DUF2971 domain-containing protein n=1 Tax=Jiangella sp. DSM 45060 TaxID=1798224 RepID=UPI00087966B9|nr:DUF2971 domain-containing protein [Jiangella sp. DSM 45060]SDT36736.1 Protein of unknown function [Jiangella sp. DSM 45060]
MDFDASQWNPSTIGKASRSVYHYTSADGLLGIVESGTLRASEASSLNDLAEIKQGWKFIRNWLDQQSDSKTVSYLRRLAGEDGSVGGPSQTEAFVVSSSTIGDDANQWRLYAAGGRGYAIELDPGTSLAVLAKGKRIEKKSERRNALNLGELMRDSVMVSPWLKVLYSDQEKDAAMVDLLEWADRSAEYFENASSSEEQWDLNRQEYEVAVHVALEKIAQLIKEPGFAGEREARTVVTFAWAGPHLSFRAGQYGISRYARLAVASASKEGRVWYVDDGIVEADKLPIKSVRLGPLLHAENNMSSVEALLKACGYKNVGVDASTVPLR